MMRPTAPLCPVYLCAEPVDFRKGMGSLAVLVEAQLQLNPFAEALFVFTNRSSTALKVLYWERNGFCLWQKRLEQDRFVWPKADEAGVVSLTVQQLNWLLDGYDISRLQPHPALDFRSVL
ncbi:IS66 family insertion sequence element accessory protein TnpB [Methylobacter sp. BlB1]|uniref:IS66 family insertion sequence element accessory protein TnpB n=1 Tax=unclassified Methylobacter TaxID=2635283 RepID=UPI001893E558|nr:IS66 family insertion sequence element accessory protein TnpB [Methylobacter sp. BlB1]MBF6651174.1 IS66 family insertion sequence element accessory protein TnpB [Methylobacter sp. BlB1]